MIKNIVFDMGMVLVGYDTERVCKHFIEDEAERKEVSTAVFTSPEWILLDLGVISEADALQKMQSRLESAHAKEMAKLCFEHWHEYCMWPIKEMEEVICRLKEKGYGIYLCSNASIRLPMCYREIIPGIEYFDGILFSAEEKLLKPQKEIYERLFERFRLQPETCFFIDDLKVNIEGAKACGMNGYCHEDGNTETLKKILYHL